MACSVITSDGTLTLRTLEWRTYDVLAETSKAIVTLTRASEKLYQIQRILRSLARHMRGLVDCFHSTDFIKVIEEARPEQMSSIVEKLRDTHSMNVDLLARLKSIPLGFWEPLYKAPLANLEAYNNELDTHIRAFQQTDSFVLFLTKRDQDHLVESLLNPPEPNEALRRAFGLK